MFISTKLAYNLSIISITLAGSFCFPLLYVFCFLYLTITYWMDKKAILSFYSKSYINEGLIDRALPLIKVAILFNLLITVTVITNSEIFFPVSLTTEDYLGKKYSSGACILLFTFLAFYIIILILQMTHFWNILCSKLPFFKEMITE